MNPYVAPSFEHSHSHVNGQTAASAKSHLTSTESVDALSYAYLRRAIGIIGTSLPVILLMGLIIFGGSERKPLSISEYYYSSAMRSVFVGSLCVMAMFLLSYRDSRPDSNADDIASTLACIFVLGVVFCPTPIPNPDQGWIDPNPWIGRLHFTCATLFFVTMAYFSLYLFRRPISGKQLLQGKDQRDRVYLWCGIIIVSCIIVLALNAGIPIPVLNPWGMLVPHNLLTLIDYRVFVFESVAVMAFGVSWLVRGGVLLADKKPQS
jgi:hypothetical protein